MNLIEKYKGKSLKDEFVVETFLDKIVDGMPGLEAVLRLITLTAFLFCPVFLVPELFKGEDASLKPVFICAAILIILIFLYSLCSHQNQYSFMRKRINKKNNKLIEEMKKDGINYYRLKENEDISDYLIKEQEMYKKAKIFDETGIGEVSEEDMKLYYEGKLNGLDLLQK